METNQNLSKSFKLIIISITGDQPIKRSRKYSTMQEDLAELSDHQPKFSFPVEGDDYKLVFISSDSSSKEEELDDASSTSSISTKHSLLMEDCDWDYFEPGATPKVIFKEFKDFKDFKELSPFGSPIFYRKNMPESPLSVRRLRESDTGTDEEVLQVDSPSSSSDSFLTQDFFKGLTKGHKKMCSTSQKSCECDGVHYIPVAVPILIPMNEMPANDSNLRAIQQKQVDLLQLWNNASCTSLLIKHQQQHQRDVTGRTSGHLIRKHDKDRNKKSEELEALQVHKTTSVQASCQLAVDGNEKIANFNEFSSFENLQAKIVGFEDFKDSFNKFGKFFALQSGDSTNASADKKAHEINDKSHNTSTHLNIHCTETIKANTSGVRDSPAKPYVKSNLIKSSSASSAAISSASAVTMIKSLFSSTDSNLSEMSVDGADITDNINVTDNIQELEIQDKNDKIVVKGSYDLSHQENLVMDSDISSSSNMAHSSDGTDSDDTGNASDRISKPKKVQKRFTKVFVVNKKSRGSDSDSNSSAHIIDSSSDEDSSDNDTNTELDCGIILNYVKPLSPSDDECSDISEKCKEMLEDHEISDLDEIAAPPDDSISENVVLNSVKIISNEFESEIRPEYHEEIDSKSLPTINSCILSDNENAENIDEPSNELNKDIEAIGNQLNLSNYVLVSNESKAGSVNLSSLLKMDGNHLVGNCAILTVDGHLEAKSMDIESMGKSELPNICDDEKIALKNILVNEKVEKIAKIDKIELINQISEKIEEIGNIESIGNLEKIGSLEKEEKCANKILENIEEIVDQLVIDGNSPIKARKIDEIAQIVEKCDLINASENRENSLEALADIKLSKALENISYSTPAQIFNENSVENSNKELESFAENSEISKVIAADVCDNKLQSETGSLPDQQPEKLETAKTESAMNSTQTLPAIIAEPIWSVASYDMENDKTSTPPALQRSTPTLADDAETTCLAGNTSKAKHQYQDRVQPNETVANEIPAFEVDRLCASDVGAEKKFTSLVMITQDQVAPAHVSVLSSDTVRVMNSAEGSDMSDIVLQHRNRQTELKSVKTRIGFYEENISKVGNNKSPEFVKSSLPKSENMNLPVNSAISLNNLNINSKMNVKNEAIAEVQVITGADTLCSAVVSLEDGLADDDSWVEDANSISQEDEFATTTATESDVDSSDEMTLSGSLDREEELRGYNRASIDFTLHTIVEESCEDSEVESHTIGGKNRNSAVSASELEKYFFFGLGDGNQGTQREDTLSETSSVCSEGLDSLNGPEDLPKSDSADLASSRLEKYFLTGFMGFSNERNASDSSSVGSDSEGRPSPEQRRKKLVRARGTGRSHSSSLDNLLAKEEVDDIQNESLGSSETDTCDETVLHIEKNDSLNDTAKRKKKSKKSDHEDKKTSEGSEEDRKTPQPEFLMPSSGNLVHSRKQHSRDSGFIGSNDDLLKNDENKSPELKIELEEIEEENKSEKETSEDISVGKANGPPPTNLTRKDSFNNWSSDEETNLMMSKMRQFFKTLVVNTGNANNSVINGNLAISPAKTNGSKSTTPVVSAPSTPNMNTPTPKPRSRSKPPQLIYFESELTRLMKTVPGIREDQVREIVEYLSSEDTWSDSYDSSDYTSSDLEGAGKSTKRALIQKQISDSCQEIINKFDTVGDEEGDRGDGGLLDDPALNKETAFVYQKLVASFSKVAAGEEKPPDVVGSSPPIIAKVMHHIGSRLVALMHEVSSGESHKSNSPKPAARYHHRRLQQKISATTTEDEGSTSESVEDSGMMLPRSKSHDLLLGDARAHHQSNDLVGEEKESDYERYSWRGSFESALLANGDSRNKLSLLENSSSAHSILAAKRRSAGDLLFTPQSLSREQLDRVRSCGSIGGADRELENSKLWGSTQSQTTRRTLEEDTDSSDGDRQQRSTLPRSLQTNSAASTNSLPRLPTTSVGASGNMQKAQSVYQFLQSNVKSARYRAPGFSRPAAPKRAVSAPGLQPMYAPRRDRRNKVHNMSMGE